MDSESILTTVGITSIKNKMKKNVWILNHYASGMLFDKGGRHYWFAKYLKREGYEPVIFGCNVKHNAFDKFIDTDALWTEKIAEDIDVPFVFVKSNLYKGNGKDRFFNMIRFYFNVQKAAKEYAKTHAKPDVIYASSVHPLTLVAGIKLAKYFGVKCICEVRDLWPLSLVEYGYLKENSLITKLLYAGEHWIYRKADEIIFTSDCFNDYILEKGWSSDIDFAKGHYINNGVDLEVFDYNKNHFPVQDVDLENVDNFNVVYTGSIRRVNNLGKLLDVAKLVRNTKVKFLIWGDGDEVTKLKERLQKENIANVVFKGRVDKIYVPYINSNADLNIAHGENAALFRFGISANKIFEYLAAGRPILCDYHANNNPIQNSNAGICVDSGIVEEIAETIEHLANSGLVELSQYGANARKGAHEYDFKQLTKILINVIENK